MIVAECPAIPGCVSQGQTEDEALANVREAIVACLCPDRAEHVECSLRASGNIRWARWASLTGIVT